MAIKLTLSLRVEWKIVLAVYEIRKQMRQFST